MERHFGRACVGRYELAAYEDRRDVNAKTLYDTMTRSCIQAGLDYHYRHGLHKSAAQRLRQAKYANEERERMTIAVYKRVREYPHQAGDNGPADEASATMAKIIANSTENSADRKA